MYNATYSLLSLSSKGSISIGWCASFVNVQSIRECPEDTLLGTVFEITDRVAAADEYEGCRRK
jgi:hypothetical protein